MEAEEEESSNMYGVPTSLSQGDPGQADEKQLAKVYRLSGEAKIKGVIEFIDQLIESKRYTLININ